jgi:hypothetical protein
MKKRGQSQIITTILILLLVTVAIVIIWNVIQSTVEEGSESVEVGAFTTKFEIQDVEMYIGGDSKVKVKRGTGEGNITGLKFIFYEEGGESMVFEETTNLPAELETKIYDIGYDKIKADKKIEKVSVVPVFGSNAGIESFVSKSKIEEVNGEAVYYSNLIPNWYMETDDNWTDPPEQVFVADFNNINHYAHRSDETTHGLPAPCYNWARSPLIPADPNKNYKFSIWIKSDDVLMNNYLGFHIYDSSGAFISGSWSNPYFRSSQNDVNNWVKWEGYLGSSSSGPATNCDTSETNGNDWCMAPNTAYIMMRFGSCYSDGNNNGHTWFMYPKIEEV